MGDWIIRVDRANAAVADPQDFSRMPGIGRVSRFRKLLTTHPYEVGHVSHGEGLLVMDVDWGFFMRQALHWGEFGYFQLLMVGGGFGWQAQCSRSLP